MNFKTESIIMMLETTLSKPISDISKDDLDKITSLNVNRLNNNEELQDVDYKELMVFKNLENLTFYNCMISKECLLIIPYLSKLVTLEFVNCEFVDEIDDFFDNINIKKLVIDNTIGLNDIILSNLDELIIRRSEINFDIDNIKKLDIFNTNINLNFLNNININELIIDEESYNKIKDNEYPFKIIVKDYTDEIVKVINYD